CVRTHFDNNYYQFDSW
nr:immunoglobulin heavy chain junction region [Macaca mulatta]MOY22669.1 immunoglobulin heavy chain junction region [Macaca mulatta]MOY24495.1 immunoglobulin heavy chain junction region [Macaca mulatta]